MTAHRLFALVIAATTVAATSHASSTNLLTVYGEARLVNHQLAGDGYRVVVENLTRVTRDSVALHAADDGRYAVTFVAYDSNVAASTGDQIRVTLKNASGAAIPTAALKTVAQQNVDTSLLSADINPQLLAVGDGPSGPTRLVAPFPEPSRGNTRIGYVLARRGEVTLQVIDASGRCVRTLVHAHADAGRHEAVWRGDSDDGAAVRPGAYYIRMSVAGDYSATRRITIVH